MIVENHAVIRDRQAPPAADARTLRDVEGGVEMIERAQRLEHNPTRQVLTTLRGCVLSVPLRAVPPNQVPGP
jgi:predicted RNase H-like nuclease